MATPKTTLKDWPKVYLKIRQMRGWDKGQMVLFARFAAATPDERWQMNYNCIKALEFLGGIRSKRGLERRKAKLRSLGQTILLKFGFSDAEIVNGQMFGFGKMERILCAA